MRLYSTAQAGELDKIAARQYQVSNLILMEHAGNEVACAARSLLEKTEKKKVAVICGNGNNGGDGLVAARILQDWGFQVSVFLTDFPEKFHGEAKTNYEILRNIKADIFKPVNQFPARLKENDLLVDAVFGTGLTRAIEGKTAKIIERMNASGKPIVAVDVPSGINGDTGHVMGVAVKATLTITIGVPKIGLLLYPGRECAGEIQVAYIPIPFPAILESGFAGELTEAKDLQQWLPRWKPDLHKGIRGRVLIIGGSPGFSGAPVLSAMGALHSGAGIVYVAVPENLLGILEKKLTEPVKIGLPQTNKKALGKISLAMTRAWLKKMKALLIGPGLGRDPETEEYVRAVVKEFSGPIVVDADALYALDEKFFRNHGRPSILLTPHEGEMAHLCNTTPDVVRKNRLALAAEKAKQWNVTVLLKGASTITAAPDSIHINPTGNPGMATGGSGDVLAGLLVALLGQGMKPTQAAAAGAFLQGAAGDILARKIGERSITAQKIAGNLYRAFSMIPPPSTASPS